MTTRPEEVTGGRQVVPDRPFEFGQPDNFVITWANHTFGVLNGKSFATGGPLRWMTLEPRLRWLDSEILFLQTILERITRYRDVLAAEPPPNIDTEGDPVDPVNQ